MICCSAVLIVTNSKVVQPSSWITLSAVGNHDSRAPNSPRSNTIAGDPVSAPGIADTATATVPSTVPTTNATRAAPRVSAGAPAIGYSTYSAPVKPSRLTPRLPHMPS